MKEYEVVAECIIGGQRIRPPATVDLTDEQAEWGRRAGVIGAEVGGSTQAAKRTKPAKSTKGKGK